jgi:PTH1 family peptidyl-tRNA hydrolase
VVDLLGRRWSLPLEQAKFDARYGKGRSGDGQPVVLLEPMTFMNRSGRSVAAALRFFKVEPEQVIVVYDDLALPVGRVRVRSHGSAGGHNGLTDIIQRLGGVEVPRVRVGIGSPPAAWAGRDYVLARPSADERKALDEGVERAADAIELWLREGVEAAMNRYNQATSGSDDSP